MPKKKFIPLVLLALLSTTALADDAHNRCSAPASSAGSYVSIPADDAVHYNADGSSVYPYEQWYWNAVLVGDDGHVYGVETLPWQFSFPFGRITIIQIALTDAGTGEFLNQFVWASAVYPHVDNGISLSATDSGGSFSAIGGSGHDALSFRYADGSTANLTFDAQKNPTPAWFDGYAALIDPVTGTNHGAQYYYNRRNMFTSGTIARPGKRTVNVVGIGWYDREFGGLIGTPGTKSNNVNWRWLSMHLSDDTDYMIWDIYANDTGNNLVHVINEIGAAPACSTTRLTTFTYTGTGTVHSDGPPPSDFNTATHLSVPAEGLEVDVRPIQTNQIVTSGGLFSPFFEGAVTMTGTKNGKRVAGTGYYEQFVQPDGCCQ